VWIVVGVYAFFGALGPVTAKYLPQIIERFGGGVQMTVPEPTPASGIAQFSSNAGQLGLLAVLVVAAGAMTFDAKPEWAAFLRTRTRTTLELVLPRLVGPTTAAAVALALGTAIAATGTVILIGSLPVSDLVVGTLLGMLYLAFAVAVVAVAASITRQAVSTVLLSVGVLIVLPILQLFSAIADWLPSKLLGATDALLAGVAVGDLLKATVVTLVVVPLLVAVALRRLAQREL
jgi:ABC-2 type transport system permease protein